MDEVEEAELLKRLNGRYKDAVEAQSSAPEGESGAYYSGMSIAFRAAIRMLEAYNRE